MSDHPWRLVAPWYRWPAQGVPGARTARETRPVIQKYAGTRFVEDFLREPQRSLVFGPDDRWSYLAELPPLAPMGLRKRRLADNHVVGTETKKLFQPAHNRFYLVVCSLHCDVTGFPSADRAEVASAGFVVRRRVAAPHDPAGAMPTDVLQRLAAARVAFADVPLPSGSGPFELEPGPTWSVHHDTRRTAAVEIRDAQLELREWASTVGVSFGVEGWHASSEDGIGAWGPVDETPERIGDEVVHPMYPLVAPNGDPLYDGTGACLFFGAVPAGSPDLTTTGEPRFDDDHVYEIRCFVERQDCCRPGPLTWTLPTDRYLLAPPHDATGTGYRPVTVTLPSVPQVLADAAARPPGRGGVRFKAPVGALQMAGSGNALSTAPDVSTMSIPLITIVATFVFNMFLGVVVAAFNLWGLLAARFSVPPHIGLSLLAELGSLPDDIDVELDDASRARLDDKLLADLEAAFGEAMAVEMLATQSTGSLVDLHTKLAPPVADAVVDLAAELVYEPHVDRARVALR